MNAFRRLSVLRIGVAMVLGAVAVLPAPADDRHDHDRARAALKAGEVLPLQAVLDKVREVHPGDVLAVELEREDGRWVYELKLLQRDGRLLRLDVDARTGTILRSRLRPGHPGPGAPASAPERHP